jgi:hypothetical protein
VVNAFSLPGVGRLVIGRDLIDRLCASRLSFGWPPCGMRLKLGARVGSHLKFESIDQRSLSVGSGDICSTGKLRNGHPVNLGPDIFFKARSSRSRPYEQYRLNGDTVLCERVTPNARSPGAHQIKPLQSWTVDEFAAANVPAPAKTALQDYLREKRRS